MALKQMVREEEMLNFIGNSRNLNLHLKQITGIPHFLQQCEKQWLQFN